MVSNIDELLATIPKTPAGVASRFGQGCLKRSRAWGPGLGLFRFLVRLFAATGNRRQLTEIHPAVHYRAQASLAQPIRADRIRKGRCWVVDGDTIVIDNTHIRIAGIDAPELDHPWGQKAKWAMVQLCKGKTVTAHIRPELSHDRLVAECFLDDGRDLAAELVRSGLALDWPKFSGGKYRHLETADARRKLWRAQARQHGRLIVERKS